MKKVEEDNHVTLIKNRLREHFKKEEPTLTKEQLENRINEITREILLDEFKIY